MVKKDKTLEEVMQDETTIDTNGVMEDEINHIKRLNDTDGISTGITMLNLALSNNRKVGIKKGTLVSFASESGLGKTATALNVYSDLISCRTSEAAQRRPGMPRACCGTSTAAA